MKLPFFVFWLLPLCTIFAGPAQDAVAYAEAIAKINDTHARQPGKNTEADLAKSIPVSARSALQRLLATKPAPDLAPALLSAGEAALNLDQITDFNAVRERLVTVSPETALKLGTVLSRPRFIIRAIGAFDPGYLDQFAEIFDGILTGYDEVFGFKEFS